MVVARRRPELLSGSVADCLLRARAGDAGAFSELVRDHERAVYTFVLGIVRNTDDARDLVQEVWVRVARALPQLRDPDRFVPWLYRIARNCSMDFHSAKQARPQIASRPDDDERCDPFDVPDTSAFVPEQHVLSLDERRKVWEALGDLSESDRTILFLRESQELPYAEIARVLDITANAAEVRVSRARERFRKRFTQVESAVYACNISPLHLSAFSDGELGEPTRTMLERHIERCADCAHRLRSINIGRSLYRSLGLFAPPAGTAAAILAKLELLLGLGSAATATAGAGAGAAAAGSAGMAAGGAGAMSAAGSAAGAGAAAASGAAITATAVTAAGAVVIGGNAAGGGVVAGVASAAASKFAAAVLAVAAATGTAMPMESAPVDVPVAAVAEVRQVAGTSTQPISAVAVVAPPVVQARAPDATAIDAGSSEPAVALAQVMPAAAPSAGASPPNTELATVPAATGVTAPAVIVPVVQADDAQKQAEAAQKEAEAAQKQKEAKQREQAERRDDRDRERSDKGDKRDDERGRERDDRDGRGASMAAVSVEAQSGHGSASAQSQASEGERGGDRNEDRGGGREERGNERDDDRGGGGREERGNDRDDDRGGHGRH